MRRVVVLSSLVTSAVWLALSYLAFLIAIPAAVEAQVNQVTAGSVTVGGSQRNDAHTRRMRRRREVIGAPFVGR